MKADIIIVNWNTGDYLTECVNSLIENELNYIGNIIIVDNNSSDNSLDNLPKINRLRIIRERENHGFGKACNIGAEYVKEKYILFLNPDTKVFKNTIKDNVEFMENNENKKISIVGSKMVDKDDRVVNSCSRFPSVSTIFFKSTGLDFIFKKKGTLMRDFDHFNSKVVDQIIGAFFMIRTDVFKKLNGFDEIFFLYMEEVDLSYRSSLLGYHSFYNSKTKCFHRGGVSSEKNKLSRQVNYLKSRLIYSKKHFSNVEHIFILFFTLVLEFISRIFFSIFKFSMKDFLILIESYFILLKWILTGK